MLVIANDYPFMLVAELTKAVVDFEAVGFDLRGRSNDLTAVFPSDHLIQDEAKFLSKILLIIPIIHKYVGL